MSASLMPNAKELSALLPLLIPGMAACILPIAALDKDQTTQKWIRGAMFLIAMAAAMGGFFYVTNLWKTGEQPFYGPLRMDRLGQFAAIFVLITVAMAVFQLWDHLHQEGWVKGETLALLLMSATGMLLFANTTNLLLLFVALELLSIPLYALTATLRIRSETAEGAMKYFLTGAVASAFFLMGTVLLYGATGSLDASTMVGLSADPLVMLGGALLVLGFFFKISAVPFHQWTPDAYEAAPHPIAGFMSVGTKGVALIALMRVFSTVVGLGLLGTKLRMAAAVLAVLTMIGGNLTALVQVRIKRMLAYSSISHAGYLLLAFVANTPQAYTGLLYYLVAYMAMNMGAFGLLTALGLVGEETDFEHLRGLGWKRPGLAIAATLCLFGLAGLPPTAGFFGKYILFKEVISTGHIGLAVVGVLASLASVYYYLRIPVALFLEKPSSAQEQARAELPPSEAPFAGATVLVSALIVLAGGIFQTAFLDTFTARVIRDWLELVR